jgi:hypothetical protein
LSMLPQGPQQHAPVSRKHCPAAALALEAASIA